MTTAPNAATVAAQIRQQGVLREYTNQKIAPYLRQAMKDMLDVDAEYPLQYLGEHLINQSMLYENNPDTTNIRSSFIYNFDHRATPTPSPAATSAAAVPTSSATDTIDVNPTMDNLTAPTVTDIQLEQQLPEDLDANMATTTNTSAVSTEPTTSIPTAAPETRMNGVPGSVDDLAHEVNGGNGLEHTNGNTGIDDSNMLNGVSEAAREETSGAGESAANNNGGMDTEMEGTA